MRGAKDEEEPKFMQRTCDICGDRVATLFESVVVDNNPVEYAYCQSCYENALKCGKSPHEEADYRLSRRTKECKYCGYTVEDFEKHHQAYNICQNSYPIEVSIEIKYRQNNEC